MTLSWRAPRNDGGSKITDYIIQKKPRGDTEWTDAFVVSAPTTVYTVSTLVVRRNAAAAEKKYQKLFFIRDLFFSDYNFFFKFLLKT